MRVAVLSLLLLGVVSSVLGQTDNDCDPDDDNDGVVDPWLVHELGIMPTDDVVPTFEGLSSDEIERQLTIGRPAGVDIMATYDEEQQGGELDSLTLPSDPELTAPTQESASKAAQVSTSVSTSASLSIIPYYKSVCPRRTYWLPYYRWLWFYQGRNWKKYCWPFQSVYIVSCERNYCLWGNTNPYYYYMRCMPIYRPVHLWFRCVTYAQVATSSDVYSWSWGSWEYKRVWLPRDCCCHQYSRYHVADQCGVKGK